MYCGVGYRGHKGGLNENNTKRENDYQPYGRGH